MMYATLGLIGVFLIVGAYLALNLGHFEPNDYSYLIANIIGAALVLISLYDEFNLPAFVIELFWLLISILGLCRRFFSKQRFSSVNR